MKLATMRDKSTSSRKRTDQFIFWLFLELTAKYLIHNCSRRVQTQASWNLASSIVYV